MKYKEGVIIVNNDGDGFEVMSRAPYNCYRLKDVITDQCVNYTIEFVEDDDIFWLYSDAHVRQPEPRKLTLLERITGRLK